MELVLPPRDVRARLYGVNHVTALELESELEKLNLVVLSSPGGEGYKKRTRRMVVKYQLTMGAAVELGETPTGAANPSRASHRFTDELHQLKRACKNQDASRRCLSSFSDQELFILSGGASEEDIRQAIVEVETFKPKNRAPIYNIAKAFSSRFLAGKLNPDRPGIVKPKKLEEEVATAVRLDEYTTKARLAALELGAQIYPCSRYGPQQIDEAARALAAHEPVRWSIMPYSLEHLSQKRPECLIQLPNGLALDERYTLDQLAGGFWRIIPDKVKA